MAEAAQRLKILAEAYHGGRVGLSNHGVESAEPCAMVSRLELEAVTVAAAILGMFVDAVEDAS